MGSYLGTFKGSGMEKAYSGALVRGYGSHIWHMCVSAKTESDGLAGDAVYRSEIN